MANTGDKKQAPSSAQASSGASKKKKTNATSKKKTPSPKSRPRKRTATETTPIREKRTKKKKGRPSSADGEHVSTPSSVASNIKFLSASKQNKLKKMKKKENKLTETEQTEMEAIATIDANSMVVGLDVRRDMWPFTADVDCVEGQDEIFILRNQANHNSVGPSAANEITNNFLDNPINANLTGKVYPRNMGDDMKCLLTWNEKVNASKTFYIL